MAKIGNRLVPQLPAQGVVGQPLGLLGDALGREPLEGLGDASVERAPPVVAQPLVRHLVREGVLERVLEVGNEPGLVEELRGLKVGELDAHLGLRRVGDGQEQREGHVLADDGGSLEQSLGLGPQAVDAGGQDGLHRGRHLDRVDRSGQGVRASLTAQGLGLHERLHGLLEEERIPLGPLEEERREPLEAGVSPEERPQELLRALRRQRVEA